MSQVNDDWEQVDEFGDPVPPVWDGPDAHRRTFIQDAAVGGGNVIAVRDNTLERTTVRISYSPTGEPILDSEYSGADFDRNGGIDGGDLAAFVAAFQEGDESADLDQNGGVDGGDLDLFLQWQQAGFMGDHTLDAQRFLYRGYHWDDTLKMYHVRHRVYDPARMLWIQRDPLGRIPGANEYAYCNGEPVDSYDPYGLWEFDNDWLETALHLVLPTKQGDAAREGFVQGAKDGATMAADNLTFQQIAPLNREAERIRSENAGDWTYEIGDGASVVGRNALLAAGGIAAGSMLMATPAGAALGQAILQSPTAVMALQGMAALGAAGGGYSVGTGIYNISTGNYKEGTVQIGNGTIALVTTFYGAKALSSAGRSPANGGGCTNQPAGSGTVPAGRANRYNISTANMSAAERQAAIEYARRTNAWIKANGGSTTVQSTAGALRSQANAAARLERLNAARSGMPYNGQAGHVPDTALTGMPNPPAGWLDMPGRSNNIIGGGLSSRIGQRVDGITIDGALP